jgi:hypothetical protein
MNVTNSRKIGYTKETLLYLILNTMTCRVDVVVASSLRRVHGLLEW